MKKIYLITAFIALWAVLLFYAVRTGIFTQSGIARTKFTIRNIFKSTSEKYRFYSSVLDENSGYGFYEQKVAINRIIQLGYAVLPWIIQDLDSKKYGFEKNRLLVNIMGNIDPKEYANAFVGLPFSEYQIDKDLAQISLDISFLKAADLSLDQKQKILDRIHSFGDKYENDYKKYNEYLKNEEILHKNSSNDQSR